MNRLGVTVVICAHLVERWPWLVRAIESVEVQSRSPEAIVLVIDGDPALAELAEHELTERCRLIVRPERGGLSAARNAGLAVVTTPLVAFLDDDAEAEVDWLEKMTTPMADRFVLGVGGRAEPMPDHPMPSWFAPELYWALGCSYQGLPVELAEVRNVFGGCAVYRSEIFTRTGGFNELLGRKAGGLAGCEETELCLRAKANFPDGRFLYEPLAVIHHYVPETRQKLEYLLRRSYAEGRSKAILAALVGTSGKLGPEMAYVQSTISRCIARNLIGTVHDGRASLQRAAAAILSVGAAAAGYVAAKLTFHDNSGALPAAPELSMPGKSG